MIKGFKTVSVFVCIDLIEAIRSRFPACVDDPDDFVIEKFLMLVPFRDSSFFDFMDDGSDE